MEFSAKYFYIFNFLKKIYKSKKPCRIPITGNISNKSRLALLHSEDDDNRISRTMSFHVCLAPKALRTHSRSAQQPRRLSGAFYMQG